MTRRQFVEALHFGRVYRAAGGQILVDTRNGFTVRARKDFLDEYMTAGYVELLPSGRYGLTDAGRAELLAGAR